MASAATETSGPALTPPASGTVSIIVPTFNRARMLGTAIDSVLNQTYPVEVIVVNHGSTDDTDAVVEAYGKRVRYIKRSEDFGPHFCWLEGLLHARGDFVHLQFDDDWVHADFIAQCMAVMGDEVGFAFSSARVWDDQKQSFVESKFSDWLPETGIYSCGSIEGRVLNSLISPAAALYRKQILIDAMYQGRLPLSESSYHGVGPDCLATLLSMLRYPKVGFVKEPLATFRSHDGSITINALQSRSGAEALNRAYLEVKLYYRDLKIMKLLREDPNLRIVSINKKS